MMYWQTLLIIVAIGLVIGFVVHALLRYAQGASVLTPMLMGIVGAMVGAYLVAFQVPLGTAFPRGDQYVWAVIGAFVLSLVTEMLFVGTRRGHVVTS